MQQIPLLLMQALTPDSNLGSYLLALLGKVRDPPLLPREQSGQACMTLLFTLLILGGLKHMSVPQYGGLLRALTWHTPPLHLASDHPLASGG
jgi:hypothetical protein